MNPPTSGYGDPMQQQSGGQLPAFQQPYPGPQQGYGAPPYQQQQAPLQQQYASPSPAFQQQPYQPQPQIPQQQMYGMPQQQQAAPQYQQQGQQQQQQYAAPQQQQPQQGYPSPVPQYAPQLQPQPPMQQPPMQQPPMQDGSQAMQYAPQQQQYASQPPPPPMMRPQPPPPPMQQQQQPQLPMQAPPPPQQQQQAMQPQPPPAPPPPVPQQHQQPQQQQQPMQAPPHAGEPPAAQHAAAAHAEPQHAPPAPPEIQPRGHEEAATPAEAPPRRPSADGRHATADAAHAVGAGPHAGEAAAVPPPPEVAAAAAEDGAAAAAAAAMAAAAAASAAATAAAAAAHATPSKAAAPPAGGGNGKHTSFAADTAGGEPADRDADAGEPSKAYSVKGTVKEADEEGGAAAAHEGAREPAAKEEGKKGKGDKADKGEKESKLKSSKSKKKSDTEGDREEEGEEEGERGRKKSKSKSPGRKKSKSKSPGRKRSKSRSPSRHKSKSPSRHKSKSPSRHKSKSPSKHGRGRRDDRRDDEEYSDDFDDYSESYDRFDEREPRDRSRRGREDDRLSYDSRGAGGSFDEPYYDDKPRFEGDISEWGRERVPDFYRKRGSSSDYTLSSGLSPRDQDGKVHREFDVDEAKNTLAYNAGLFGRAQTLRKAGQAPKTLGIADDLPDRFAYHQLEQLAGMAQKVQDAIEHNKRVFQKRVEQEDLMIKKKAFNGWRAARYGTLAKQQLLKRVLMRMQRSRLAKAFFAWKDKFGQVDKNWAMRRKLQSAICRGRLRRCFEGWRKALVDRWWQNQLETRDHRIHALERRIAGFELRPIVVLKRRMLSAVLTAWYNLSDERRRRRMRFERAAKHFLNRQLGAAWNSWYAYHLECQRRGDILKKAALRMKNLKLASAWNKWMDLILAKREHETKLRKALGHWKNRGMAAAWDTWWQHVLWRREKKKIIARWKQPLKAKAFYTWIDWVAWRNRMRTVLDRTAKRMLNSRLAKAWDAWRAAVQDSKMDFHLSKKEELALQVKALTEENERLRRDNERFVRLIDSGEWGRGRVAELVSAGEVLKGERDALMKLIQSMRKEYESVQMAKGAQDDELKRLKERMLLGGAARNKMLVKGASSYNALKRAIKQDLVEAGAAPSGGVQDPNLLYEIDKLSMDRVSVFPDGDINIEAVSTARGSAVFARPVSAAHGVRSSMAPAYPVHVPQGLTNLGQQGRPGQAPSRLPANSRSSERVVQILSRLQSLTPAEIDKVEDRLRAEAMARAAAGPSGVAPGERGAQGMSSSARR